MRYCRDKRINKLVADLVREGWQFSRGKHGKLRNPSGIGFVTIPSTPSDYRTFQNLRHNTVSARQTHLEWMLSVLQDRVHAIMN